MAFALGRKKPGWQRLRPGGARGTLRGVMGRSTSILFVFTAVMGLHAEPAEFRTWTDVRQARVEAAFLRAESSSVTLQLRDGREVTVPMAQLSPADRAWIADRQTLQPPSAETPRPDGAWPRTVALKAPPEVRVVREDAAERLFIYESEHYEFVSDAKLSANLVREFSRVFEVTWLANCLLPLDWRPEPEPRRAKFRARIFTHREDYHRAGGVPGSAGVYGRQLGALMLPLASLGVQMVGTRVSINYQAEDYATLIHEITHQMMNHWLDRLPTWFIEGSAEYVELADYENGRLSFLRNEARLRDRLQRYGARFPMVGLRALMNMDHPTWSAALGSDEGAWQNYASALALTYFFYHLDGDGRGTHMIDFIRAVGKLGPRGDPRPLMEEHLLRGRDYAALEAEVQRALRRARIDVEFMASPE